MILFFQIIKLDWITLLDNCSRQFLCQRCLKSDDTQGIEQQLLTRKTIMICDDQLDLLNMYKMALEKSYNVLLVDSGKDCINKYIEQIRNGKKIDVLLLDYKLGDMLGDIVARKISELNGVKTIMISAYDLDPDTVRDLIEKRCIVGTIRKPISLPVMINQIELLLNGSHL